MSQEHLQQAGAAEGQSLVAEAGKGELARVPASCIEIEIGITATTRESVFHTRSRTDLVGSANIT